MALMAKRRAEGRGEAETPQASGLIVEAMGPLREAQEAEREAHGSLRSLLDRRDEIDAELRVIKGRPMPSGSEGIKEVLARLQTLEGERGRIDDLIRGATAFHAAARERATEARRAVETLEREAAWLSNVGIPDAERGLFARLIPLGDMLATARSLRWSVSQDVAELRARRARLAVLEGREEELESRWAPVLQRLAAIADELETLKAEVEAVMRKQ